MLINQIISQLLLPPGGLILLAVLGMIGWKTGLAVYPSGGSVLSVSEPEGLLMQDMLIQLGLPAATIHAEIRARNTWENAVNVQQMLKRRGITTVLLVTTAWLCPVLSGCLSSRG